MAYASIADAIALVAREPEPEVLAMIERRLEQVERKILRKIPDLAGQIEAGQIDWADEGDIEVDAVLRLLRNPDGYVSESDGPYSYQFSRETASGRLEILAEEWERLGLKRSRLFSINPNLVAPVDHSSFWTGG